MFPCWCDFVLFVQVHCGNKLLKSFETFSLELLVNFISVYFPEGNDRKNTSLYRHCFYIEFLQSLSQEHIYLLHITRHLKLHVG